MDMRGTATAAEEELILDQMWREEMLKEKLREEKSGRSPFVIIFRDVPGGEHSSRQKANHVTA